jgi:DNA-binding IclR family transcriptional regulator
MQVKSAARALHLLEVFDQAQTQLTLGELVLATRWPQSSLAALLATLSDLGYVHHNYRRRTYALTAKVAHLGEWIQDADIASEPAMVTLLNRLHESCGETVVLAEQAGLHVRYVKVQLAQRRPVSTHTQAGVLRPLCASATGWSLLSLQSDLEIRSAVRDVNRLRPEHTAPVELRDVRCRIEEVRKFGFVVSRHAVKQGIGMIAMPFSHPWRGRRFAVGVGAPVSRLDGRLSSLVADMRNSVASWKRLVNGAEDDELMSSTTVRPAVP